MACAGDKHLYTVLEQQQAQIAQGNLMGSDHTYVIPQATAGAAAVERRPQGGAAKRQVPLLQLSCFLVYRCCAVACMRLFFSGLSTVHLPWRGYCLLQLSCCPFLLLLYFLYCLSVSCLSFSLLCCGLCSVVVSWRVKLHMVCVLLLCHSQCIVAVPWPV